MVNRFNNGHNVLSDQQEKIEQYFKHRWANDKNQCMSTQEDLDLLDQLPDFVQREIFSDFLFAEFLTHFRVFFDLPKTDTKIEHAYYKWDNEEYQEFMIEILKSLEPRTILENILFYEELDEVNEILFIEKGEYDLGYEVNKI